MLQNHSSEHLMPTVGTGAGAWPPAGCQPWLQVCLGSPSHSRHSYLGMVGDLSEVPLLPSACDVGFWPVPFSVCPSPLAASHPGVSSPQDLPGASAAATVNAPPFSIQQSYNCPFMSALEITPGWPSGHPTPIRALPLFSRYFSRPPQGPHGPERVASPVTWPCRHLSCCLREPVYIFFCCL